MSYKNIKINLCLLIFCLGGGGLRVQLEAQIAPKGPDPSELVKKLAIAMQVNDTKNINDIVTLYNITRVELESDPFLEVIFKPKKKDQGIGSLSLPNLLADFLADLVQKAAIAAALESFRSLVPGQSKSAHRSLPRVSSYITSQTISAVNIDATLQVLRADFRADIGDLPVNLEPFIDSLDTKKALHERFYLSVKHCRDSCRRHSKANIHAKNRG